MNDTYTLALPAQTIDTAPPDARPLLEATQKQMGMVPNMYANMANSPGLLSTYTHGYNLFRKASGFTPAEQEIVFLTISRENGCTYCMAAHSWVAANSSKVPAPALEALRAGKEIAEPKLGALSRFTSVLVDKRGRPSSEDVKAFIAAGFSEHHILEVILAIAVKTLSNYSNHLFGTTVDAAFADHAWSVCSSCDAR